MPYPTPSKELQLKRLASTPGKGVGAGGTGHGTADINIPEMPAPPAVGPMTPAKQRVEKEKWQRWRENLAAQFPVPMVQSESKTTSPVADAAVVHIVRQRVVTQPGTGGGGGGGGGGGTTDLTEVEERLTALEEADIEFDARIVALEAENTALSGRIAVLEEILLTVTTDRLLGRWSPGDGPAQEIKIGTGLDLVGDTLVNTGGGVSVSAFTTGFSSGFE